MTKMLTSKFTEFPLEKGKEKEKKKTPTMNRNWTGDLSTGVPKEVS